MRVISWSNAGNGIIAIIRPNGSFARPSIRERVASVTPEMLTFGREHTYLLHFAIAALLTLSMWRVRPPYHWVTDGQPHCRKELHLGNKEATAIMTYFYEAMPEDTEVRSVERFENRELYMSYAAYKQNVVKKLGWSTVDVESLLFHSADQLDAVLSNGFRISHARPVWKNCRYGVGVYFARGPRLADYFIRQSSGASLRKIILARVTGWGCG